MCRRYPLVSARWLLLAALCLACALTATCSSATPSPMPAPAPHTTSVPSPAGEEPIAVLTYVEDEVLLEGSEAAGMPTQNQPQVDRRARPFQSLLPGAVLRLAANARATVVCFNDRFFQLTGDTTVRVTDQWCRDGTPLPSDSVSRVKPDAGRVRVVGGSLILEEETREKEGDYGRIPIILSPRNTGLLDSSSELRWVEVPDAMEYVLSLIGPSTSGEIVVDANALSCRENAIAAYRVCSMPWPAYQWSLEAGQTYFLTVSARLGIASKPRLSQDSRLDIMSSEDVAEVHAEATAIQALDLDAVTKDLLLAGLYAEHELYGDAISTYERTLAVQPSPVLYVTLGDAYRKTALYRWALVACQETLDLLTRGDDDPAVRAAAEFGIGQVYFNYAGNYAEAEKHYAAAVQLYEQVGAEEPLLAARQGLEEARRRSP